MTEAWDWRQSYARYSDTIEGQGVQHAAPESPEVGGPGHQPYAVPSQQDAGHAPPVAQRGGRGFSIAAFICGGVAPFCFPLIVGPFILGPLGVIFGFVAKARGDRIGRWAAPEPDLRPGPGPGQPRSARFPVSATDKFADFPARRVGRDRS